MHFSVGGNPPLADCVTAGAADGSGFFAQDQTIWVASGRDAILYLSRILKERDWYLPDFICGIVPATLQLAGNKCIPYRPERWKGHSQGARIEVWF
jgi:hypothetical protein